MTDMIHIDTAQFGDEEIQAVSAKRLYEYLGARKNNFSRWCQRNILDNAFAIEGEDYIIETPSEESNDYILRIDFAKKLCMVTDTPKGEEVRKYFVEVEKKYKTVVATIKPKTTLEMLKEAVELLEAKEEKILQLETRNRQADNTNARIYDMKAKDTKTGLSVLKDDAGRSINHLVMILFGDMAPEELTREGKFKWVHNHAHTEYKRATGVTYLGAKVSSLPEKRRYLDWLLTL